MKNGERKFLFPPPSPTSLYFGSGRYVCMYIICMYVYMYANIIESYFEKIIWFWKNIMISKKGSGGISKISYIFQNQNFLKFHQIFFKICFFQNHTCIRIYTHTYMHTHIHTYTHTYNVIHTMSYIRTYLHTYTYIHTYIHAHIRICMLIG